MNNYWEKRAIASAARTEKAVNSQEKYLEATFESARKRVGSALADFYLRYANENGVTFAEAQQCLSEAELKEFRGTLEDFNKMAKESFGTYNRELENLSMRVRVTRLQALEAEIKAVLDSLYGKVNTVTTDTLQAVYESSYYHTLYDIDKYTGILHNVAKLNTRTIQNAVQYPYSGLKFSERIWGYQVNLNERLKAKIVEMCIQGKNPRDYAAVFAKEFDTQTFYAKRLLATEAAYNSNAATMKAYEEDDIEKYEICATLDSKTSKTCREQDGKVYDLKDAKPGENHPPFHPFCRTTTVPVIDGVDLGDEKRVARDESGKVYKVPENMTYSEWKKYIVDDVASPQVMTIVEADEVDDVEEDIALTDDELYAMNKYAGKTSYLVNEALRNGEDISEYKDLIQNLDSALMKIPTYSGNLKRSVQFYDEESLVSYMKRFSNKTTTFDEYISTTKNSEPYNPDAQVQILINNAKKGHDVSAYMRRDEDEVLYERNSTFKVLSVTIHEDKYYVELEEM